MTTIREVAFEAGVSIGTVSRVLNNKPGVSEKTRQHVLSIAQKLSYILPPYATSSTITHLSLLACPMKGGLMSNPFYADVLHGVEQTCRELHLNLSFNTLDITDGHLRSLPPSLKESNISGIILLGALPKDVVSSIIAFFKRPIVLVDNSLSHSYFDTVMIDNLTGMHLAIELLVSQGHHHISLLGGPEHPSIMERCYGYELAMRQRNLPSLVVASSGLEPEDGEWGVMELLQKAPETTAIICSNDFQAIGALRKLQQLGYQVPGDFSLVGFDDITLTRFTSPPLTTIQVDRDMLGQMGVQLLLERVRLPARTAVKTTLGVRLVERGSVAPPRSHQMRFYEGKFERLEGFEQRQVPSELER